MKPVAVLNGPNLNLLGLREPAIYGHDTLDDAEALTRGAAAEVGLEIEFHQSNHEGVLVDLIQAARTGASGIIINPAGFTTTSVAILDSLLASELPVIEVHVTNIHRREEFRQHSFVSKAAQAVIAGAGIQGYDLAVRRMATIALRDR
ncbi:type II 3-dehydroquinate dehydratase [Pseudonocardia nematodicida]|uniref:3-dehydroquinate dehydratase n=1 Tax=Pseudonocardia nematodicida TaxID=1206997 RepID=A0ABV1K4A9_9PSEU